MDPQLFESCGRSTATSAPSADPIISSYRSPETNAMLRGAPAASRSSASTCWARRWTSISRACRSKSCATPACGCSAAASASIRPQARLRAHGHRQRAALATHDARQLARVFPNGRTVHVPTDGSRWPGYAQALADLEKRGSNQNRRRVACRCPQQRRDQRARRARRVRGPSGREEGWHPFPAVRLLDRRAGRGRQHVRQDNGRGRAMSRDEAPAAQVPMPQARPADRCSGTRRQACRRRRLRARLRDRPRRSPCPRAPCRVRRAESAMRPTSAPRAPRRPPASRPG